MGSKLKSEKNNIGDHGEHSTMFDTTVIQRNNEYNLIKKCSVDLASPINLKRLEKYARKFPETTEELTFGLHQKYPKRRKIEHYQKEFIKNNFIGAFNAENQTIISVKDFRTPKFKPGDFKSKHYTTLLQFSKLNPEIVLDFIKQPSVNKLMKLLNLMYIESINFRLCSNDLTTSEQSRRMSMELKKYLFELCYQKFSELWPHKTASTSILSTKQLKRFITALLRHTRSRTSICNMNLKKLILYNGRLTGYPKKPHLVLCINIISSFFTTLLRKSSRMLYKEEKANAKSLNEADIRSIKLYHQGTTKMKGFLEIVNEYKRIIKTDRLSYFQVADIKHAYEGILQPGQYIDENDLKICAYENYEFRTNDDISSKDSNTSENEDFDFDDIDSTPESELKLSYNISPPKIHNYFKPNKFPQFTFECVNEVQSRNYFGLKSNKKNGSIEVMETEVHIQSTSNENRNINRDISTNDLEGKAATNYSGAEISSDHLKLKRATKMLGKKSNNSLKSKLRLILYNIPTPKIDNYFKADTLPQPTREFIPELQAIVNQDMDISTGGLEGTSATNYSGVETSKNLEIEKATNTLEQKRKSSNNYLKISERFNNTSILHPIQLSKSEKRMLSTIICSFFNPCKVTWKRWNPSKRTRLYQVIIYFGSLKMSFCDKLHLGRLDLRDKNICDMIDFENLLKSIKIELCLLQECFTFTEVKNFLVWPLGKKIVNYVISQRSLSINTLFSFVKNIVVEFCDKVKDFCRKFGLRIVLNEESLFESLCNVRIGKYVLNTELSEKHTNVYTYPSLIDIDEFSNDMPGTSNSEHVCITNTGFYTKKNSLNKKICQSMVNILESDDFIHQSWKECYNLHKFISKLLKAGVTLPIKESKIGDGSKFIEVYVRQFCEEFLQNDKSYKLAVSIFKNISLHIDTASKCTDIKVEDAVNNASMILSDQPCFVKTYESHLNTAYPKCLSSTKHDSTDDTENHSDFKGANIRAIEELQIEPNVNVRTDPIDTNNVDMSLVPSNIPTFDVFNVLNNVTTNNLVTLDLQSTNYDLSNVLLQNIENKNCDNLLENIGDIDDNGIFNAPEVNSININDPNYSIHDFNENCPFGEEIDYHLTSNTLESNLEFQQVKNEEKNSVIPLDRYVTYEESGEELNLQFEHTKNMEEVSMIFSDQLVHFDQKDEINPNELSKSDDDQCGFYNAGVLLPP